MVKSVAKKQNNEDVPGAIRTKAEKRPGGEPARAPARTHDAIIHELRVRQAELEMQNEALRKSQLALEQSRNLYLDLYDFAPVGYVTLKKNMTVADINLTGASILGMDRHQIIGKTFLEFIARSDLMRWSQYYKRVMGSAGKAGCELNFLRSNGSPFRARLESTRSERNPAEPVLRMVMSDSTDREKTGARMAHSVQVLDDLGIAYREIATGQEELRKNEARLKTSLEEKEHLLAEIHQRIREQDRTDNELRAKIGELTRRELDLKEALAEKEILLAEIHHRVKNNLTAFISLLSLDGAHENTEAGQALRKDLQNRARSMALIHETLYRTGKFSSVNMDLYLTNLVTQIAASYAEGARIHTEVVAGDLPLDISRATTAGLIVNELVTNSFKYAFPPGFDCEAERGEPCTIRVALSRENGVPVITVTDNGIGLPAGLDPLATRSLGLKLVNFLARYQLKAEITVRTGRGTGYVFRLNPENNPPSCR